MKSILFTVILAASVTAFAEDSSSAAGISTNSTVTAGTNDTAKVKKPQKKTDAVSGATWKKRKPQ